MQIQANFNCKHFARFIYLSQNICKYSASGSLSVKKTIQNIVFPDGLLLDTEKRQYLSSKVNSLFSLKRYFIGTSGGKKEKLLIKNYEGGERICRIFDNSTIDNNNGYSCNNCG